MKQRAAVLIGVNTVRGVTDHLKAAVQGAKDVERWLRLEGFDTECVTDENKKVTAQLVREAIEKFVKVPPRYDLLLVYFSGHGYWQSRSDLWLLSDAPSATSEAINLTGAMDLAKYSGIPNVVFISDACRVLPATLGGAFVQGIDAFPFHEEIKTPSKIDVFRATSTNKVAYEVKHHNQSFSVLTAAIMSAFSQPEEWTVREVNEGKEMISVVPNRRLEKMLQDRVNDILAAIDPLLQQTIEASVPSDDDIYVARVNDNSKLPYWSVEPKGPITMPPGREKIPPSGKIGNQANLLVADVLSQGRSLAGPRRLKEWSEALRQKVDNFLPNGDFKDLTMECGFVVKGAITQTILPIPSKIGKSSIAAIKNDSLQAYKVILDPKLPVASFLISLNNGKGSIIPALKGYIGEIVFSEEGLANVNYLPSSFYKVPKTDDLSLSSTRSIHLLRALIAVALNDDAFRVSDVKQFADLVRANDPTLGLYAAHALSHGGMDHWILFIMEQMRKVIFSDFFDVRLLARRLGGNAASNVPVTPACPMLTQSWNLLRSRGVTLTRVLEESRQYLCDSLWTTYDSTGMSLLLGALKEGELHENPFDPWKSAGRKKPR